MLLAARIRFGYCGAMWSATGGQVERVPFAAADRELSETLDNLDEAKNYAAWIFAIAEPHLGSDVLEVGAGHGTFTELLSRRASRVVANDLSVRCTSILRHRFRRRSNVEILDGTVNEVASAGPFDTALLINVLEHIDDDNAALADLYRLLQPGGNLILWVPAFPALYSEFDRKIGHFRRYRSKDLFRQLSNVGFDVHEIRYVNALGAVAWFVVARMLRKTPTARGPISVYDHYFVPVLRHVEQVVHPPFGQSLFVAASRPGSNEAPARPAEART
jgi:SAM-dependent methyltransferase